MPLITTDSNQPSSSIIVIAWRLSEELQECLDSLRALVDPPSHEVIVVLNGVAEAVRLVAENHPAVDRVIRRSANIGFGAACNIAVATATGQNVVFLNDDTRVDPFWLTSLVQASARENVAAVASLLLNFDGTVQEAGSRILTHGGTLQLGKGLLLVDAAHAGLLERRPVDYGSAAALLVNRAIFLKLGGFDPLFEPAYFEDVDLQLRIRETGGEVWLEPEAKVLHHSGRSTSADHWFRQFAANRSGHRFLERWSEVFSRAAAPDDPPSELCHVPRRERSVAVVKPTETPIDASAIDALRIATDYEQWLSNQLDQLSEFQAEITVDPAAPSRREILDQMHELRGRLRDLEERGPVGIAKMRLGLWLNRRASKGG